ncbi:hypothetical protein M3J07_001259 [Ascochyta lentis]
MHTLEGAGVLSISKKLNSGILGRTIEMTQYLSELSSLASITRTCRQFRPVAERILYQEIHLPQLTVEDGNGFLQSLVPLLARTLFDRPDLASYVNSLEIWVRNRRLVRSGDLRYRLVPRDSPYLAAFFKAAAKVASSPITADQKSRWLYALSNSDELALQAALIATLPRLQRLTISGTFWCISSPDPRIRDDEEDYDRSFLDIAIRHSSLTKLRIAKYVPVNAFPVSSLTQLELDINFFTNRATWLGAPLRLPNVTKMSVIASHIGPLANFVPLTVRTLSPQQGLIVFMRESVPNVKSFTIQSQTGTVPFHGTTYDSWDQELTPYVLDSPQDIESNFLDNLEDDKNAWDWLMNALQPVEEQLIHLGLPLNWYSSTGTLANALPSLEGFVSLKILSLPLVAIIPNRYSLEYVEERDEIDCINFLPSSIRCLEVSQVDVEVLEWIQDMLRDTPYREQWLPLLSHVRLIFREDYAPVLPEGMVEDVQKSGLKLTGVWRDRKEDIGTGTPV